MKRSAILLICLACVGSGVAGAPFFQWLWRVTTGAGEPACISTACVGQPAAEAFNAYGLSTEAGGLDAVLCGRGRQAKYIWWREYVFAGKRCEQSQQTVIMRSPQYQTNFEIEGGRITKIARYPLPQIDL